MVDIKEVRQKLDCIFGECGKDHEGECQYNPMERTCDRVDKVEKVVRNAILQTRIDEAEGFDHGNEAWSGNMEDEEVQSNNPVGNYAERLKKEMES